MKATDLLKKDHAEVKKLFAQFGRTTARAGKARQQLVDKLAEELEVHAKIEEEIFYPAMEKVSGARSLVEEAREEHETMKSLLGEARGMARDSEALGAKLKELKDATLHHATEEEREMFREAKALGADRLERLGAELRARKEELVNGMPARARRGTKRAIRKVA
jgi:iron-sulfur cluster repair protein YtfE (RIC family)